jgi:hypothetical protein
VSLNDGKERLRKPQIFSDCYAGKSMMNIVRTGPSNIMKKPALPYQLPVNVDLLHLRGKRDSSAGNRPAMRDHPRGTPSLYQNRFVQHRTRIIPHRLTK